jgi:succinate dehydrogenase flavin-adding protein (antitoxin of CptAB toxin-antitoxin module)
LQNSNQLKAIIHQSRRGLKELDVMLELFNQHHLASLSTTLLEQYSTLLKLEDHDLLEILTLDNQQINANFSQIITMIKNKHQINP